MELPESNEFESDWDAFRYVAGEMSADEIDAFEQRLADPQDGEEARNAREAVARVAQVVDAVAQGELSDKVVNAASSTTVARPSQSTVSARELTRSAGRRRLWLLLTVTVACLLLVSVLDYRNASIERAEREDAYLVEVWLESLADEGGTVLEPFDANLDLDAPNELVASRDVKSWAIDGFGGDDVEFDVPGWVLAAIEDD